MLLGRMSTSNFRPLCSGLRKSSQVFGTRSGGKSFLLYADASTVDDKAKQRSQRAFLFGAGQDLIAAGRKGITFRLSLFLRFQQSSAWLSSRGARGKCTKSESNEQRHFPAKNLHRG